MPLNQYFIYDRVTQSTEIKILERSHTYKLDLKFTPSVQISTNREAGKQNIRDDSRAVFTNQKKGRAFGYL